MYTFARFPPARLPGWLFLSEVGCGVAAGGLVAIPPAACRGPAELAKENCHPAPKRKKVGWRHGLGRKN